MTKWIKIENRPRNQKFRCPHCNKLVYSNRVLPGNSVICEYPFCPYCRKSVSPSNSEEDA